MTYEIDTDFSYAYVKTIHTKKLVTQIKLCNILNLKE
jgi:hypothetical protein